MLNSAQQLEILSYLKESNFIKSDSYIDLFGTITEVATNINTKNSVFFDPSNNIFTESSATGVMHYFLNTYVLQQILPSFWSKSGIDLSLSELAEMMYTTTIINDYLDIKLGWYTVDLYLFLPEIFFFFSFLIVFTFVIITNIYNKINFIALISILNFFILLILYINNPIVAYDLFFFSFTNNYYIFFCRCIILIFSMIFLLLIPYYFKLDNIKTYEYIIIYNLIIFSLLLLLGVNDFLGLFLCLELQSLSLYVLATYKTQSTYSTEAGMKYFILGAIATGLILFGISLIYGFTGTINFSDLTLFNFFIRSVQETQGNVFINDYKYFTEFYYRITQGFASNLPFNASIIFEYDMSFLKTFNLTYFIGFFFILVGFLFKLGIAPFHMWLPDVYEGSPTITTALFASIPKLAIIFFLIRILVVNFYYIGDWYMLFTICGILSIFIGTFGAMYQNKIKRLMAYSAISHMGFISLSLSNFTAFNFISALFYANTYILLNLLFFFILITLRKYDNKELILITDLASLKKNNPVLSILLSLTLFSIAGIPPLMGFYSKLLVLLTMVNNSMWFILFITLILSMISAFYYIRLIKLLFFDLNDNFTYFVTPSRIIAYIITLLSFINIFFCFFPNIFFIEICNLIFNLI